MQKVSVQGMEVSVRRISEEDYLCLTDMIKAKDGEFFFHNWLRNRNTIEFLGIWEKVHNADFNYVEFDRIKSVAGLNNFRISAKEWISSTNAIGLISKAGRYGGTYAHKDIAFEFAMWISPEFKVYLIKDYERLKSEEQKLFGWTAKRELSKLNYRIHTDAIKANLIPNEVSREQAIMTYADEADVLNMAMFGMTAKQWRAENPDKEGNIRDYASINELICLANMENLNAVFINDGMSQADRLIKLNRIAIHQMQILKNSGERKQLK